MKVKDVLGKVEDYLETIIAKIDTTKTSVKIDCKDLARYSPELTELLLEEPGEVIEAFEIALNKKIDSTQPIKPRFYNLPDSSELNINRLRKRDLGKLLTVQGVVTTRTKVYLTITHTTYECPSCGNIIEIDQTEGYIKEPRKCGCGRKGWFRIKKEEHIDTIMLKLDELPEKLIGSEQPADLRVILGGPLCEKDYQIHVGARVKIVGILKPLPTQKWVKKRSTKLDFMFEALSYENLEIIVIDTHITEKEKKLFDTIKNHKNPAKFIANLLCSDIHGHNQVKEVCILQQFGGTKYQGKRDFIHILLYGAPGTGKTDIAFRCGAINPICKIGTGSHISGVGLTASLRKDDLTGNFVVVGGLLPRCHKGVAVIDELDKMGDDDKKCLHEPMESGYFSVDKGGIHAELVSNTAILATSNPKVVTEEPIVVSDSGLPLPIIDRFDLIFTFSDEIDDKKDEKIADNILERATLEGNPTTFKHFMTTFDWNGTTFHIHTLKKYVYLSRRTSPKLSRNVKKEIRNWYVSLRQMSRTFISTGKKPTPRTVESILRLARAIARMKHKDTITHHELKQAINYFDFAYMTKLGQPNQSVDGA